MTPSLHRDHRNAPTGPGWPPDYVLLQPVHFTRVETEDSLGDKHGLQHGSSRTAGWSGTPALSRLNCLELALAASTPHHPSLLGETSDNSHGVTALEESAQV